MSKAKIGQYVLGVGLLVLWGAAKLLGLDLEGVDLLALAGAWLSPSMMTLAEARR